MKTLLIFMSVLLCAVSVQADIFRKVSPYCYTNGVSLSGTNGVSSTNSLDTADSVYHTFHFVLTSVGTNTTTISVDRTINSVNWFNVGTVVMSGNGTSITETNFVGKWASYRFRATFANSNPATPIALTAIYMGQ